MSNICLCGKEYKFSQGLSKHKKTCEKVIIEEYKKTLGTPIPANNRNKKHVIDYLNEDCAGAKHYSEWVENVGKEFTNDNYDDLIENGIGIWKETVIKYIEKTKQEHLPIRILNKQQGSKFKIFIREKENDTLVWKEMEGVTAFEFFNIKVIRRMGRRMGNNIENKNRWKEHNPYWDRTYDLEKRYMAIGGTFGDYFDNHIVTNFAEEVFDYFLLKRKEADDEYI
jgi:hypothetical protein